MSANFLGLVLAFAFILGCHVFPTANGAEGFWQTGFDPSTAIRGGYEPGVGGESWLCRHIEKTGLAKVGAYFASDPGCRIKDPERIIDYEPLIKDPNQFQLLASNGAAHSYSWIRSEDVSDLTGAIEVGSSPSQEKTYVCRATVFITTMLPMMGSRTTLRIIPGTYFPSQSKCVIANIYHRVHAFDILFDLYSMCDNNVNTEYKKGTWSSAFDQSQAVQAGQEENPGELSYVCRVQMDSRQLLGKRKSSGSSCTYADGQNVEYSDSKGVPQEVLVSTPSNLYGWSPQKNGKFPLGAIHGYVAQDGEPIYICRALADVDDKAPRSPGSLRPSDGVCVTAINNRVARNPKYEVLVDMRRVCDERFNQFLQSGSSLSSGVIRAGSQSGRSLPGHVLGTGSHNLGVFWPPPPTNRPRQQSAPTSVINSRSESSGSNEADAEEYLARGLNAVKLALDSYASA